VGELKAVATLAFTAIGSTALSTPCALQETCAYVEDCEGAELTLELLGTPPELVQSNFGDFSVDQIARAGEITSKIRLSNGQEWTATAKNDLLTASRTHDDKHINMYVTKTSDTEVAVTLLTLPMRYVDYAQAGQARRAFSGKCGLEF
jgi:hypothetical protein